MVMVRRKLHACLFLCPCSTEDDKIKRAFSDAVSRKFLFDDEQEVGLYLGRPSIKLTARSNVRFYAEWLHHVLRLGSVKRAKATGYRTGEKICTETYCTLVGATSPVSPSTLSPATC